MTNQEIIDAETGEVTEVAVREPNMPVMLSADPVQNFRMMRALVSEVAESCKGPAFRANIKGRDYPTVQWWTTVGASLGLFPYEMHSEKILDDAGNMAYESFVEVRRNGVAITSASAICSTSESTWANRDEYAIKSMATTRAVAKAYRLGLSFLAVLAGLEATPAEEMPRDGGSAPRTATASGSSGKRNLANAKKCPEHGLSWVQNSSGRSAHPIKDGDKLLGWCNQDEWEARESEVVGATEQQAEQAVAQDTEQLPW